MQIEIELGAITVENTNHFAKDCPTSKEDREIEQIQQMFNLDEEQTSLKTLAADTYDSLSKINSLENIKQGHLNL